jgi:pullulanase/glycogen debranching enzyme
MKKTLVVWCAFTFYSMGMPMTEKPKIRSAKIQAVDQIVVSFTGPVPGLQVSDVSVDGGIRILGISVEGSVCTLRADSIDVRRNCRLAVRGIGEATLQPDGILDGFVSSKPLGCIRENGRLVFRLFAPRALNVILEVFDRFDQETGRRCAMVRDADGVWECTQPDSDSARYYGYRVEGPEGGSEMFNPFLSLADPYATALATRNHFSHPAKSLIPRPSAFDWEGDTWICPAMGDLIVYEMHVRDMTAHPSSGVDPDFRGKYLGLIQEGKPGGIDYIASLGVNAVELLPVQEFGNLEVDFRNPVLRVYNDWNPYARNHWGYMTSGFFAPESYYATDGGLAPGGTGGLDGRAVDEFKAVVKTFHRRGIAVLLDVVYNHVSNYDQNPFKHIDKKYYFRLDDSQEFVASSGCGNDFKTERPMARRLIVESLVYWMREFHVDGFRFDLATLLDSKTLDTITVETRRVNPDVILIAEPWGGGRYGQEPFSERGWGAWNDWFRNGVKGQNPVDGLGFVFGRWQGGNNHESLRRYVLGTTKAAGGPFVNAAHSVNYLESHDDHTFGDFLRIGTGTVKVDQRIVDRVANARLNPTLLRLNKLGALFLMTSQGAVMIHEGQEYGRSKVIASTECPDPEVGRIDHNSYNKDNETNWIDYGHSAMNRELVDYYRGLIGLRKRYFEFRRSGSGQIEFIRTPFQLAVAYRIRSGRPGGKDLIVILNGNPESDCPVVLPKGTWSVIVDGDHAGIDPLRAGLTGSVTVPLSSGMVLLGE